MHPDSFDVQLLLDLEADGVLTQEECQLLAENVAPEAIATSRAELAQLHAALRRSRVEVRAGFHEQVLAAVGPAGWEARHLRGWRLPLAAMVVLGVLAATLLGRNAAESSAFLGLAAALGDFVVAVAVAGGGFATASWRGVHLALTDLVGASLGTQLAFGVLAVGANLGVLLLVRNVRRRSRENALMRGTR